MEKAIKIYNSLKREKEPFTPLNPKEVKMYVCGPTVYDEPHIGHARSAYIFDVIRRYLIYKGYKVKFVRNVTDVDDKIIDKAIKEYKGEDLNSAVKKVAEKYLSAYHEAMSALNISSNKPDVIEPKATEYIDKMIEFIKNLINRGVAYESGGDIYFDIKKAKNYGKLSNQLIDKMESGARVILGENKKDPLDFVLWKSAKEGEPSWDSEWGKGRPGWHIECSVMSSDILGDKFDIHGGGIDLIFPHHENEIAQSEGAGKEFAKYWIHHGLLTINGQKMSKSLGNFITIKDFVAKYQYVDILKLFFLSTHYSHPIDYTEEKIAESSHRLESISLLMGKIYEKLSTQKNKLKSRENNQLKEIKNKFISAMNDDFNTPLGLAAISDLIKITNKNIDDLEFISQAKNLWIELAKIFGLDYSRRDVIVKVSVQHLQTNLQASIVTISQETIELCKKRDEVRKKRDFKEADKIRKELEEKGFIVEDTQEGTKIRRKL